MGPSDRLVTVTFRGLRNTRDQPTSRGLSSHLHLCYHKFALEPCEWEIILLHSHCFVLFLFCFFEYKLDVSVAKPSRRKITTGPKGTHEIIAYMA
jgi:hypothetical protein